MNKVLEDLNKSNVVPSFATITTAIETLSKLGMPSMHSYYFFYHTEKIIPFVKDMQKHGFQVDEATLQKLLSITGG